MAWSTPPTWTVGEDITAADLQIMSDDLNALWAPPFARKTATESVTSSTTLQNDDALVVAVEASQVYRLECLMRYDAATTGDLKVDFSLPASASLVGLAQGIQVSSVAGSSADDFHADFTAGTPATFGGGGAGNTLIAYFTGILVVSSTAGNCQLQWAQNTSSGTATRVFAQSFLSLRRVA